MIAEYLTSMEEILSALGGSGPARSQNEDRHERYQLALAIARMPEQIRGFGHVKARSVKLARQSWEPLLAQSRDLGSAQKRA
jgi:indolepyruvate ferredoxin oxidoreductase